MSWLLTAAAALAGLFVLDRVLRWMEHQGWIYYRLRRPSSSGALNALAELHAMLSPQAQQVVIAKKEHRAERDDDGGPDDDDDDKPRPPPADM